MKRSRAEQGGTDLKTLIQNSTSNDIYYTSSFSSLKIILGLIKFYFRHRTIASTIAQAGCIHIQCGRAEYIAHGKQSKVKLKLNRCVQLCISIHLGTLMTFKTGEIISRGNTAVSLARTTSLQQLCAKLDPKELYYFIT